jgi:diguanylate cyclase
MRQDGLAGFDRLARPLLQLTQHLTGLETSFVTEIDWDAQQQTVLFALNTAELQVLEGTVTEWSDSTCRLAFLSNTAHSSDVPTDFPGSRASERMGMRTFLGLPILNGDAILGTLCGASCRSVQLDADAVANVGLIAQALSFQLASHLEGQALRGRAERAEALALVDPLTGLANRRAFTSRFEEELARSARHDSPIAVLAIDLDRFKAINDTYGHPAGDRVLVSLADVLRAVSRT